MHSNKIIRDPLLQTQCKTHAMPEISTVLRQNNWGDQNDLLLLIAHKIDKLVFQNTN